MSKILLFILGAAASLGLILSACNTAERWTILPLLSPPVVTVPGRAMDRAEEIAKTVPKSLVFMAHGSAIVTVYPPGTALVIQQIDWNNLKPGMTAIYYLDPQLTIFAVTGGIITRKEDGGWLVPQIEGWHPSGTGEHPLARLLTKENYIGVVVAAFIEKNRYDPKLALREAAPDIMGTCALRCHVTGP
jgi:hypothetical protein